MTKEEALKEAKYNGYWLLRNHAEWNGNKEIALAAVQKSGWALRFVSDELRNDKEVVMAAVNQNGRALQYASDKLRKDKDIILTAVVSDIDVGDYSLLEGYQNFFEIIEKEGEGFLFSCWNSEDWEIRLQVANHPNFLPTLEQIETILNKKNELDGIKEIYKLRKDEWLAKIEENKLRNTV